MVKQKTHGTESVDPVPSTVEQTQADATDGKYSLERPNTVLVTALGRGGVAGTRPHAPFTLRFLLGTPHKYITYIRKYIFDIITVSK